MPLFDFNAALGRFASPVGGAFDTPKELLAEMHRLGISDALVYHAVAAETDIMWGNRLLLEAVADTPNLHACWVMAPPALKDLEKPETWVRDAVDGNVRAARMFPRHSLYTLAEWCVGGLLTELEAAELPLLLDFGLHHWSQQVIPWQDIRALCEKHPRLNVVIIGSTVGEVRDAFALLATVPNLHLEFHALNPPDLFRLAREEGFVDRLVFGSGLPRRAVECVVEQTLRSGLDGDGKAAIMEVNARRLLSLVDPGHERTAPPPLPQPFPDCAVIDVHMHYGAWERTITTVRGAEKIVNEMRRCGIHKMVGSSFTAIHGEQRLGNRQTAAIIAESPGQLYGYCAINPHYPEDSEGDIRFCFNESTNFAGFKFHCFLHETHLTHPGYERALAYADEHELPVLVHGGGKDDWEEMCGRYPRAAFIIAHACLWDGFNPEGKALFGLAKDVPNLYMDTSGSGAWRGATEALVELVSDRKILYGSDFPMFDFAFETGRIKLSALSKVSKTVILGGNALRLFKRIV